MLNTVLGNDRFPVDIPAVAQEYTRQKYANDSITRVVGADLPGFDGALFRAPQGKAGWGIFHNNRISSQGRINFRRRKILRAVRLNNPPPEVDEILSGIN